MGPHATISTSARAAMQLARLCAIAIVSLSLMSCATDSPHRKAAGGMTMGAAIGAIVGTLVGGEDGAALGALIGAGIGGLVGAELDAEDHRKRQAALDRAAYQPAGGLAQWSSPEKETAGQVAKVGDLFRVNGRQCMQVEETISIKGNLETATDIRCQNESGQWIQAPA